MIPVIDLFAGPGGLGEGFSSLRDDGGNRIFKVCLSIEKDVSAHRTLELRSFFRQFPDGQVPKDYYRYIRKKGITREELFAKYRNEADQAQKETWNFELADIHAEKIDDRIRKALGRKSEWVLIGGPPCQAYSTVGRARMRGKDPLKFDNDHRHYLYREYLRILETHRPPVFIMENVKGLLSSQTQGEGIFEKILSDLSLVKDREPGYKLYSVRKKSVREKHQGNGYVVHSEKHGIPQTRHRVIILGIRADLKSNPGTLVQRRKMVRMWDAIRDLPRIRSGLSKQADGYREWAEVLRELVAMENTSEGLPDDIRQQMRKSCRRYDYLTMGGEFVLASEGRSPSKWLRDHSWWFEDKSLKGFCNHSARFHMKEDLHRYLFASCYGKLRGVSPRIVDLPEALRPAHSNIAEALKGEMFDDRFRVQVRNAPATTIVSHIAKDGHYFIHPDPTQCRSLTVREAARLQTFPDNYFFEGSRTSQYTQVGNAVPPLLARQIAQQVVRIFSEYCSKQGKSENG